MMKGKVQIFILLFVIIAIMIPSSACNPRLDLSFTEKIFVEYKTHDEYLKFEITDRTDIDAIVAACTDNIQEGSGNCGYEIVKLTFAGGQKEVVLRPAGDNCDTVKYGDRGGYFRIGDENKAELISILRKYGASFDYLGTNYARFSTTVNVEDRAINISIPMEKYNRTFENVKLYTLSKTDQNIEEVVSEILDPTQLKETKLSGTNMDRVSISDGTNTILYDANDCAMKIVMNGSQVSSDKIVLSTQEGWEVAKQFIIKNKILTEKELLELAIEVTPIGAQEIDVNNEDTKDDSGTAFITDYLIKMRRQIDGIPLSDTVDGVKVLVSDEGVYWLNKKWNEVISTDQTVNILSIDEIFTSMQTELVNMQDYLENITITDIRLIYYPSKTGEKEIELVPAWECTYANGTLIFDACNGKLIGQ